MCPSVVPLRVRPARFGCSISHPPSGPRVRSKASTNRWWTLSLKRSRPRRSLFSFAMTMPGTFPAASPPCWFAIQVPGTNAHLTLSSDSFVIRRLKSLSSPLQLDAAELGAWKLALTDAPSHVIEKRMQEKDVLLQTRSSLLVQLRTKGDLLGVLTLGKRQADRFSAEDREMLESVAGQLALVIENTKLLQRLVEHERLRAELVVAAEVQRNLLPATGLTLPGIDLCGFCQPASQVGGDYYDFVRLGDDRVGICIADVAGKGISAALLMSVVQASLRGQLFNTQEQVPVRNVVTMLNRLICSSVTTARYVTCFYGQLDPADGSFRFVNAGHNPPLLLRQTVPARAGAKVRTLHFRACLAADSSSDCFPTVVSRKGKCRCVLAMFWLRTPMA